MTGQVHLVGAGPGDPGLLTLKAAQLLCEADVVIYDRLVSQRVLDLVPTGTARLFVGKTPGNHHLCQDEINALLVNLARHGHVVVCLKGGDPLTFARGSEEAEVLAAHGVPFTIIPGISAAVAVGASLGIPMTHRGLVTGVRFVTGHCREDGELDIDWESLADPGTTLVVYMGLANIAEICEELHAAGLPVDTPACAVANGTTPDQRQCRTTLEDLPRLVGHLGFEAPVLLIIGQVVAKADQLNWQNLFFETEQTTETQFNAVIDAARWKKELN